jgi:hypothetical protein
MRCGNFGGQIIREGGRGVLDKRYFSFSCQNESHAGVFKQLAKRPRQFHSDLLQKWFPFFLATFFNRD